MTGGRLVYPNPCRRTDVDDKVLNHEENKTMRCEKCIEFTSGKNGQIPVFSSVIRRCAFLHIFCTSEPPDNGCTWCKQCGEHKDEKTIKLR